MAAAAAIAIPPPEELKKKGNLAENWCQWKQNFEIYLGAAGIAASDSKASLLFLHSIGQYGRNIFNGLGIVEPYNLAEFYTKFDEHFIPKPNLTFERYMFFNIKQTKKQTFDKFLFTLKQRSANCEFGDLSNSLLISQIIIGITNDSVRKHLLTIRDLTLDDAIEACKSAEATTAQAKKIETAANSASGNSRQSKHTSVEANLVDEFTQKLQTKPIKDNASDSNKVKQAFITNCKFCSKSHAYGVCPVKVNEASQFVFVCSHCGLTHKRGNCPAWGSSCNKCKQNNHFAKMCKK